VGLGLVVIATPFWAERKERSEGVREEAKGTGLFCSPQQTAVNTFLPPQTRKKEPLVPGEKALLFFWQCSIMNIENKPVNNFSPTGHSWDEERP